MRGSKKKYVYLKLSESSYVKARVLLKGDGEPSVTPTMDIERIIVVSKPLKKVPRGYKIIEKEDIPHDLLKKLGVEE